MIYLDSNKTLPGQPLVLQFCVSVSFPIQSVPLNKGGCVIVRFLSWVPPPHVTEQVSHALHTPQVQLTGLIAIRFESDWHSLTKFYITWATISIAVLGVGIIARTISAIKQGWLVDCPVSLLCSTTTGCRTGFPCTPCAPGAINWELIKMFVLI